MKTQEQQDQDSTSDRLVEPSRRAFGRATVAASIGAIAASVALPRRASAQGLTDVDILNFALNLEYLEAEFYTKATTGRTIEELGVGVSGTGNEGPTTGGRQIDFGASTMRIMREVAADERNHVNFLRAALGSAAVAKPAINLDALGAFSTDRQFLALARAFEDVGVSAYGGAARLIQDPNILEAAARIALTEAYHAGNVRLIIALKGIATRALDANDFIPPPSGTKYFPTSRAGLAKIRTPSMVLAIVYGSSASGTDSGGFFPEGVNGRIRAV